MSYKLRKSDSSTSQKIVAYTQGGILIRFNEIEVTKEEGISHQCDEFWFETNSSITDIEKVVNEKGFELTKEHKTLLS